MAAEHPEVELEVGDIAHGGVCVARLDGRVVFLSDAIPGERVVARITDTRHDAFWRAETVRVLDASEYRVRHVWDEAALDRDPAERAGGAEFGHIQLAWQRELKRRVLADALERFAGHSSDVSVEASPGDDESGGLRWRTRVTLHVDRSGRVGPYAARSHRVIPTSGLPLAVARVEEVARLDARRRGVDRVEVVSDDEGVRAVEVRRGRITEAGRSAVHTVAGREYRHDALGFWQVHREAAGVLASAVVDAVDRSRLDAEATAFDLYGGVGLFAGALADGIDPELRVISVEADAGATGHARANLADLPRASAETASVGAFLADRADAVERVGLVVLDPPRKGAGRGVVDALARMHPDHVVYVACDPVALARDVGLFAAHGYRLDALRAFDLFPHTHHLEAVARLVPES